MNYKKLLIDAGKKMLNSGLTVETWGNISLRDPATGYIYLTPSAMPYNTISEDDVVVLDGDGNRIEGERKPTIEYAMHLEIMKRRPDVNAIIHTHPIYSQVFGALHEDIPPIIDEAAQTMGGTVKTAKYAIPGTKELADNVADALGSCAACLMANHGAVCVGANLDVAFKTCTVLEMTAKIYYMARSIGTPQPLSQETIDCMLETVCKHYGQGK